MVADGRGRVFSRLRMGYRLVVAAPIASVAVLGTGTMGAAMARNIAAAGIATSAWNRTPERAEPLAKEGIAVAASPVEAAEGADAILTMLPDADAVAEVAGAEVLDALAPDGIWIQASTVGVDGTQALAGAASEAAIAFVDAPVSGTKEPAEQGQLVVLASGNEAALGRCSPVFDAIGAKTVVLGDEPGAATRMKLVLNAWLLALTSGLAEAINLAEALGVDPERFLDTIEDGPLDSPYAQLKGAKMIARDFAPSFGLAMAGKDARLALEAAAAKDLDLPLLEAVREKYVRAEDMGHGDEDMSAVYEASSDREDDRPAASP
jgi:3-hydroxyisobutyrate dehydrogenase